ncbi:hypothetical protein HOLleu_18827 [Holothuria leucospilota]|uniref:Uncharacterized protein n=1 Tax=Holothuria leucospilota TaxID=206669 RepID=A0A9Q1H9R2_HOLLE|nr:hypothetical protein HOLleu_18827 [Holothuria leucospilota]
MDAMSDLYSTVDRIDKNMEESCLQVEGEDLSASDVNVYITIDPASLQKLQKKRKKRTAHKTSLEALFRDCMEELDLETECQVCCTKRGLLMIFEAVLALTLLLISAISYPGDFGYEPQPYFIVVNSLNLVMCLLHLIYQSLAGNFSEFTALRKALSFVAEFFLLVLQVISFIVVVAAGRPEANVVIFTILTLVQCACLIMSLIFSNQEIALQRVNSLTKSKKERLRRKKMAKKKYKRLHHSGI